MGLGMVALIKALILRQDMDIKALDLLFYPQPMVRLLLLLIILEDVETMGIELR
jgi:hypothetical protein